MERQATPSGGERYFLSHSGKDKWVALLVARIMNRHGIPFWLDVLHCQDRNDVAINRAIEKCECIVVISSRSYDTRKWCRKELRRARKYKNKSTYKRIECLRLERNDDGDLYYEDLPGTDLPKERPVKVHEAINDFFSKFVKSNLTASETRQLPRWIDDLQGLQELGEPWTMNLVLDSIGLEAVPPDPFSSPQEGDLDIGRAANGSQRNNSDQVSDPYDIPQEDDLEIGRPTNGSQRNNSDQVSGAVAVAAEQAITRDSEAVSDGSERRAKCGAIRGKYLYSLVCLAVVIIPLVIFLAIWFSRPDGNSSTPTANESNLAPVSGSSSTAPTRHPLDTMESLPTSNAAPSQPTTSQPISGPMSAPTTSPNDRPTSGPTIGATSGPTPPPTSDPTSPPTSAPSARPPPTPVPSSSPSIPEELFDSRLYIRLGSTEGPLFFANTSVSEPVDFDGVVNGLQQSYSYRINSVTENDIAFIYFTYYSELLFGACRWTFDNAAVPMNAGLSNWIIGDDCWVFFETRRMDIQVSITQL